MPHQRAPGSRTITWSVSAEYDLFLERLALKLAKAGTPVRSRSHLLDLAVRHLARDQGLPDPPRRSRAFGANQHGEPPEAGADSP